MVFAKAIFLSACAIFLWGGLWGTLVMASPQNPLGPPNAPVTIEEFSDLQCPFCARSVATLKQILKEYPKQVKIIFRHFPVVSSHPDALLAHMALSEAGRQGRFWEMHDLIFENMRHVSREHLIGYAKRLGLDRPAFEAGLQDRSLYRVIDADYREGLKRQVRATPTFFINGRKIEGAVPYALFKQEIDAALLQKKDRILQ